MPTARRSRYQQEAPWRREKIMEIFFLAVEKRALRAQTFRDH
jgi:hypothetical protein